MLCLGDPKSLCIRCPCPIDIAWALQAIPPSSLSQVNNKEVVLVNLLIRPFENLVPRFYRNPHQCRCQQLVRRWLFLMILGLACAAPLPIVNATSGQSPSDDQEFSTIQLQNAGAERVVALLNDLFGDRKDTSILLDRNKNRIVIQGPREVQINARNLAQAIEQSASKSTQVNANRNTVESETSLNAGTKPLPLESNHSSPTNPGIRFGSKPKSPQPQASFNNPPNAANLLLNPQTATNSTASQTRWLYVNPQHQLPLQQNCRRCWGHDFDGNKWVTQTAFPTD